MYFESVAKPDLTWSDAIWWAFVTMTTVGYGDFFPATAAGRYLIGIPTMVFGISILGYLLSTVATYLIEARSKELKGMLELNVKDPILIIHYPDKERFLTLLRDLCADDKTAKLPIVLVDDTLEELPEVLMEAGVQLVLEQLTNNSYGQQIYISPITTAKGRTYSDVSANLHERGMMVLGIERDRKVLLNPEPSAPIDEGDKMILIADKRPSQLRVD